MAPRRELLAVVVEIGDFGGRASVCSGIVRGSSALSLLRFRVLRGFRVLGL